MKTKFAIILTVLSLTACTTLNQTQTDDLSFKANNQQTNQTQTQKTNQNNQQLTLDSGTQMPQINPSTESAQKQLVTLKTSKGDIQLEIYPDIAPQTVKNFLEKASSGYYQNLTFHRVEDWVIQGGDPLGTGTGGGKMPTELSKVPFVTGSLGVARGQDIEVSNDSQFFICTTDCAWLTGQYTNFGKVAQGLDVAQSIEIGDKIISIQTQ